MLVFSFEGPTPQGVDPSREKAGREAGAKACGPKGAAGADDDEDPPVPMPNTEVKLVCAEDTWMATSRKNRQVPALFSFTKEEAPPSNTHL